LAYKLEALDGFIHKQQSAITMNDESTTGSSSKHVSFSALVDVIEDSAFEYVDLPPIIFESFNESDSIMSITDLTETSRSERFYEAQQSLSELNGTERPTEYYEYGEESLTSMSFHDLYDSYSPGKHSIKEVPAIVVPTNVYNEADLNTTPKNDTTAATGDDDGNDDDDHSDDTNLKQGWTSWFCGAFAMIASVAGMMGCLFTSICRRRYRGHHPLVNRRNERLSHPVTHHSGRRRHYHYVRFMIIFEFEAYMCCKNSHSPGSMFVLFSISNQRGTSS
jgi:hypothetical protein